MYEKSTKGIRVRVTPQFVEDQSEPDDSYYFWAYTVEIANQGEETVQLRSRYWHITDANGHVEEVRGPGVVGKTPILEPGERFSYTSGCPLNTSSGIMHGNYVMERDGGDTFEVTIPAFSLDSPFSRRTLN